MDMSRGLSGLLMMTLLSGFITGNNQVYPPLRNESFGRGEVIHFKMTYGIFTVGRGTVNIHPDYHRLHDRDCFKVDVHGKTSGMVDWFRM
jgi:hypothetical protein